jgi:ubiquinone/menaquinone biosynthesis C-methylase UbiE
VRHGCDDGRVKARVRLIGRAINTLVAHAPWLWPVLRPAVRGFFDDLAPRWDEREASDSVRRLAPLATAALHVRPVPERVLDVGTGTGQGALFLAREFPRASVRGIDFSEPMIREAQRKIGLDPEGRVAFRVADAADLPFDEASFDLVTLVNMPPFFGEIARVLRPGGFVIVTASLGPATPFYTSDAALERAFGRRGVDPVATGTAATGTYWVGRRRR